MELMTISVVLSLFSLWTTGYGVGKKSLKINISAIFISIASFVIVMQSKGWNLPNLPTISEMITIIFSVITVFFVGYIASGITYVKKDSVRIITP
jgi:hypothetical protein